MIVTPVRTDRINPGSQVILDVLEKFLPELKDRSVVAITSKIISLCEGSFVAKAGNDLKELIKQEADYYMPGDKSKFNRRFTLIKGTLNSSAGIDKSNGGDVYVLWPADAQKTANEIRHFLCRKFGLKEVGVIITDSTSTPMRLGASGIAIAFSGFDPINDYRQKNDLFGQPFTVTRSDVAGGLAAAAVAVMGEGTEQTPIAIIEDAPFVKFRQKDPTQVELKYLNHSVDDDLFEPLISGVEWLPGKKSPKN